MGQWNKHGSSQGLVANIRRVLAALHDAKRAGGGAGAVDGMLARLYGPILFRGLAAANAAHADHLDDHSPRMAACALLAGDVRPAERLVAALVWGVCRQAWAALGCGAALAAVARVVRGALIVVRWCAAGPWSLLRRVAVEASSLAWTALAHLCGLLLGDAYEVNAACSAAKALVAVASTSAAAYFACAALVHLAAAATPLLAACLAAALALTCAPAQHRMWSAPPMIRLKGPPLHLAQGGHSGLHGVTLAAPRCYSIKAAVAALREVQRKARERQLQHTRMSQRRHPWHPTRSNA